MDEEGLTYAEDKAAYLAALGIAGEAVTSRLGLLGRLLHGAGCSILTGPRGVAFWQIVSPEVKIRVVPDDIEVKERFTDLREWAYRAVGFSPTVSKQLLARKTPVPVDDWRYSNWVAAAELLAALESADNGDNLVVEDFPVEQWRVEDGLRFFRENNAFVALDWEWDIETGEPVGWSVADSSRTAYVPLRASDFTGGFELESRQAFTDYLNGGGSATLHGGRADLGTQFCGDPIDLVGKADIDDTMVMAYLAGEPILNLKDLSRKYLGRDPVAFPGNLSELPVSLATRYAGADARNTYDLFGKLAAVLYERGQWDVYREIERPLVPIVASMERYGIPVDIASVKAAYRRAVAVEQGVRRSILDNYGFDVAKDTGDFEHNEARQFVASVRGADPGTLDQRTLTTFPEGEIDLLLLHRRSRTLRRNFLGRALKYYHAANHPTAERRLFKSRQRFTKAGKLTDLGQFLEWKTQWERLEDPTQFRYFPRFNQAGSMDQENRSAPRSGRFSSSSPNFQQQPRGMREIFVPPPDMLWWSFDYSGLELHIAAALSQDAAMLESLTKVCSSLPCEHKPKCGDLHSAFQYKLYDLTGSLMDRALVKTGNFEQLYGGGAGKLVEIVAKDRTHISLETAQAVVEGHKKAFPGFHAWADERRKVHKNLGYATTYMGRRRYIPEIKSRDPERQSYGSRAGINHEIQGTAADIVKIAMRLVAPVLREYGAHMCAQVHDELDGWIGEDADVKSFMREMEEAMTSIELPGMKLKIEGSVGKSWGEAH